MPVCFSMVYGNTGNTEYFMDSFGPLFYFIMERLRSDSKGSSSKSRSF